MKKSRMEVRGSILAYSNVIYKEDNMYIAWSPEFDIACQGDTIEDATEDLETSIKLYMTHPHARISKIDFVAVASKIMQLKTNNKMHQHSEDCEDCEV